MTVDEALETLDAALLYKGLIAVPSPGGFRKVQRLLDVGASAPWLSEPLAGDSDRVAATLVTLENTDPGEIAGVLRGIIPSAVILPYPPTNGLILASSEARLRRLLYIASSLDAEQAQRLVVIPLRYRAPEDIIPLIEGAYTDPSRPDRVLRLWAHPSGAHLIVDAREDMIEAVRGFVKRMDVPVSGYGEIHIVPVLNADAQTLAQQLSEAFAQETAGDFTVVVDAHTHSLVIRSDPATYGRIAELIAELDRPQPRILVEVTVFEVNTPRSKRLGFNALVPISNPKDENDLIAFMALLPDGIAPFLGTGGLPGIDEIPELPPGIDLGNLDNIDLSTLDLPAGVDPAVLANLAGVDLDALRAAAIEAAGSTVARFTQAPLVLPVFDENGELTDEITIPLANAAVIARDTDIETRTHLNPRLLLLPGEEQEIFVGDNVPVPVSNASVTNPLEVTQNIERADVGITLRVKPTLSGEGPVQLELHVTSREVAPSTSAIDVDRVGPVFRNRQVESVIRLWPGEVAVIASRLEPITENRVSGTPWLKDIPFFGYLFKSVTKRELNSHFIVAAQASLMPTEAERRAESLRRRVAMDQFDERMAGLRREAATPYALRVAELVEERDAREIANAWSDSGYVARVIPWEALDGPHYDVYLTDFGDLRELGAKALELSGRSYRPEVVVLP